MSLISPNRVILGGRELLPLAQVPATLSDIEWQSLLYEQYCAALDVALKSQATDDALKALAAWQRWLSSYLPDERQRAAIPTPRLLRDIFGPEGQQS
jgi:hypothetical protein